MRSPPLATSSRREALRRLLSRVRAWAAAASGPIVILASVLIVQHAFAFGGKLTDQHEDLLSFWLPNYCSLGRAVAHGHVPLWNPAVAGGLPFAADPQTGWAYLPAMLAFAAVPCDLAMRWFLVLQPALGGLALYGFLRTERLGRVAATIGGLVLAVAVGGSWVAIALPFAAAIAWTAVVLLCAARCLRAPGWARRLLWAAATAVAWGQLAAAYGSNGLAMGTVILALYLLARLIDDAVARRRSVAGCLSLIGLLAVALPIVNLAILLPHLHYLPRTTLGMSYGQLKALSLRLGDRTQHLFPHPGVPPEWILRFARGPGVYMGAGALALSFAGAFRRRTIAMWSAFAFCTVAFYIATLRSTETWAFAHFSNVSLLGPYFHDPARFRYGLVATLPVLIALGVQAWQGVRWQARAFMLLPGLLLWWFGPTRFGMHPSDPALLVATGVAMLAVLVGSVWRRPLLVLLVPLVAVELIGTGLSSRAMPYAGDAGKKAIRPGGAFPALQGPAIDAAAFVRPDAIARVLHASGSRYLSLAPRTTMGKVDAFLRKQASPYWPLQANQRSMLFGSQDVSVYDPVQPLRFWTFVRLAAPENRVIAYNVSFFVNPPPIALDLLQVGWVVGSATRPPLAGLVRTVVAGEWALYRIPGPHPRASVVGAWRVAPSSGRALRAVLRPGFDPGRTAVLESDPGIEASPTAVAGSASYRSLGPAAARLTVRARAPSVVVVRTSYDPGWHATVDGRAARVFPADYVDLGVAVPPGRHTVLLTYTDPWIGRGLAGSGIALALLLGAALALSVLSRLRSRPASSESSSEDRSPGSSSTVDSSASTV